MGLLARRRGRFAALAVTAAAASLLAAAPAPDGSRRPEPAAVPADELLRNAPETAARQPFRDHRPSTGDRYRLANGCFTLRSGASGKYVVQDGDTYTATATAPAHAEPFHLRAFDLGKYLLYGPTAETDPDDLFLDGDFLAAAPGPIEETDDLRHELEGRSPVTTRTDIPRSLQSDLPRVTDRPDGDRLPSTVGDTVIAAADPSPAAEWIIRGDDQAGFTIHLPVDDGAEDSPGPSDVGGDAPISRTLTLTADGGLVLTDGEVTDDSARWEFVVPPANLSCPVWPEVEVGVSGPHHTADTPYEEARGYVDGHLHMMAFEFLGGRARCGRPWHPYGVSYALVDCPEHEPGGAGDALEFALSGVHEHDTTGWPEFPYWPDDQSLTHEQVYFKWLERAWRGGLRTFTNLLVDNSALCDVYPYKRNSCNEMDGVLLQAQRLRELERYVDAQHGGPGQGWFRIVTDPFDARRTINEGRLAVVMGIEVSVLFDCGEFLGVDRCTTEDIDRQLAEVHELGVRQLELVNKFDNALSGVAGDSGTTGPVVNQGNKYETGHYWHMDTCEALEDEHGHDHHGTDKTQMNFHDESNAPDELTGRDSLAGGILALFGTSGTVPVYPEGPHCNTTGLRPLGQYLIERMIARGMIFDPDHMSARGRAQAMDLLADHGYSGVISSHSWADHETEAEIWQLGGVVTPMTKDSTGFVDKWQRQREFADPRFVFGLGYGADTNGFASQGRPRNPDEGDRVEYPFTGFGGAWIEQQVSGVRAYDLNVDGVDHYGLYPDWIEDLRILAGDQILEDMARAPEAYLQMWERAIGIPGNACRDDLEPLGLEELEALPAGLSPEQVLREIGQPDVRVDDRFEYCVGGGRASLRFDAEERLIGRVDVIAADHGGVTGAIPPTGDSAADATGTPPEPGTDARATDDHAIHGHTSAPVDMAAAGTLEPARGSSTPGALRVLLLVAGFAGVAAGGLRRIGRSPRP